MPSEKQEKIYNLLTNMRNPKGEKTLFKDYLSEAWDLFDLNSNKSLVSLEALLIEAIMNITIHKENLLANKYKDAAQKCDAYLLALGLLDGYYHTKNDGTHYIAAKRHKNYLSYSDYMELILPTLKPTDNIDINDAQSKPRWNISQDDKRCRQYLGKYLSTSANCQKCLIDGIKNHTHIVELDGHKKRKIKLPEPCFTLDNFSSATEQKSPGSASVEDASSKDDTLTGESIELENELGEEITELTQEQESEPDIAESTSVISLSSTDDEIGNSETNDNEHNDDIDEDEDNTGAQLIEPVCEHEAELEAAEDSAATIFPSDSTDDNSCDEEYDAEKRNDEIHDDKTTDEGSDDTENNGKKHWVVITLILFLCIGITVVLYSPKNKSETEESESDLRILGDPFHEANGKDMEKLAKETFFSIALYDDSGEYRIYDMCDLVQERIMDNPIFGDMAARGMLKAFSMRDDDYFADAILRLSEFIEATDRETSKQEDVNKKGLSKWLTKSHDVLYTTDDYKEYAGYICELLEYSFSADIQNLKVTSYWELDPDSSTMEIRTTQRLEKRTVPALVFSHRTMNGTCRCIFGFLIEDGSFVISDPYEWGVDSFIE